MEQYNNDYEKIIKSQNEKVESMFSIDFLTPENASVRRTEGGLLSATVNGKEYKRVRPVRCFPFTNPSEYISLREGSGNESKEIGMLRNIDSLGAEAAALIKEQLDMMYFMPLIKRIKNIREEYGYSYWDVGGNSINKLSETRLIINDLDGNRFEIGDTSKLTGKELKMLDLYL